MTEGRRGRTRPSGHGVTAGDRARSMVRRPHPRPTLDPDVTSTDEFFAGSRLGSAVFERVQSVLTRLGPVDVRVSKSQVAFHRRRGFAYLWLPGAYLEHPGAEVVLSIALEWECDSPRFKEIAHPASRIWQHHLELRDVTDLDDEVERWLQEAYEEAR